MYSSDFEALFIQRIVKCMKEYDETDKRDCTRLFSYFYTIVLYAQSRDKGLWDDKLNIRDIFGEGFNLTDNEFMEQLHDCFLNRDFEPSPISDTEHVDSLNCSLGSRMVKMSFKQIIDIATKIENVYNEN